ncbi:hypothetical protein OUZ56_024311 [Daphnia magna]|uniref:Uncharacterized protein n=1 Tax=Daphnia magna TaxID=35525 RepID=A0ABR0B0L8_9CRUS|nr:hypothetical protein OUZ56_024311 [Daphnia magna]
MSSTELREKEYSPLSIELSIVENKSFYTGFMKVELQENKVETFEGYPVPKDCVSQSIKVKFGTE